MAEVIGGTVTASIADLRRVQEALDAELVARAIQQGIATTRAQLVVRDLSPTDLGAANETWSQAVTANAWATAYTGSHTKKIFGIHATKNSSGNPLSTMIRFGIGTGPAGYKDKWVMDDSYLEPSTLKVAKSPIIYNKEETFTIDQYGRLTGTDNVIFMGRVVERLKETIVGGGPD